MKKLFVGLFAVMLWALGATVAHGHPSVVAYNASRITKHEQRNILFGYTVEDSTKLVLSGDTFLVERTIYYPAGSQYLFSILKETFYRVPSGTDWFICTNASEVFATYRTRGGGFIGSTNVIADYWNERDYPGGNGTVIYTSDGSRFTTISQTTYRINNTGDEQSFKVHLTFDIGGAYVTDTVFVGAGQVVMYTPSLATLARKARRKVNGAGLARVDYSYAGAGNFTGGIYTGKGGR